MAYSRLPHPPLAAAVALALTACTGSGFTPTSTPETIASPTIRPDDIVGRWGYAAYYNDADRPRIEAAARSQCSGQPIEISRGPSGGLIMPIANQPQAQEVMIQGGPGGRNYLGPPGQPNGAQANEIISFDGKVLIVRTATNDQIGRLNSVYVRCAPKA